MKFWESLASIGERRLACLVSKVDPYKTSLQEECLYQCDKCMHIFYHRGKDRKRWCPFCVKGGTLCPRAFRDRCTLCTSKTLGDPNLLIAGKAARLSIQDDAYSVRHFSKRRVRILCKCGHTYTNRAKDIQDGRGCPFCGTGKLCKAFLKKPTEETCLQCFRKSFASVDIQTSKGTPIRLLYRGSKNLDCFNKHSNLKCTFECEDCGKLFEEKLRNISRGTWCPCRPRCKKTEHKVWLWLREFGAEREWSPKWLSTAWITLNRRGKFRKGAYRYRFDFVLGKLVIEIDGPQHFRQIARWKAPRLIQIRDKFKEQCARKRGYTILRLLQEHVLKDKIDWRRCILSASRRIGGPTLAAKVPRKRLLLREMPIHSAASRNTRRRLQVVSGLPVQSRRISDDPAQKDQEHLHLSKAHSSSLLLSSVHKAFEQGQVPLLHNHGCGLGRRGGGDPLVEDVKPNGGGADGGQDGSYAAQSGQGGTSGKRLRTQCEGRWKAQSGQTDAKPPLLLEDADCARARGGPTGEEAGNEESYKIRTAVCSPGAVQKCCADAKALFLRMRSAWQVSAPYPCLSKGYLLPQHLGGGRDADLSSLDREGPLCGAVRALRRRHRLPDASRTSLRSSKATNTGPAPSPGKLSLPFFRLGPQLYTN